MTSSELRTARLTLRPLHINDAEALLPIFSDPDTMRYWAHGPVTSLDKMRQTLSHNLVENGLPSNGFAICEMQGGPALGWVNLYAFHQGNAGAGYILAKSARGRGYAREALAGLLDYAFGPRAVHRVFLEIDPANTASVRLAQTMGFRWEGHFKESFLLDGIYCDSVFYAMLAREWRSLKD